MRPWGRTPGKARGARPPVAAIAPHCGRRSPTAAATNAATNAAALVTLITLIALVTCGAPQASAQTSREELLAAEEAARARAVTPPGPAPGERLVERFSGPVTSGFTPSFGGLIPGGGLNAGIAYTRFFADTASWAVRGVYSVRQFSLVEGSTRLPDLWDGRLLIAARGAWSDGPRVEFFGRGADSREDDRVYYGRRHLDAGVSAALRPVPLIVLAGGADFLRRQTGHNRGSGRSLEERFSPDDAPGFEETLHLGHYFGSAGLDWRNAAGYAERGGLARATLHTYQDAGSDSDDRDDRFSFDRLDVDLVQHVPILRANWIVSLRGRLSTTMRDDGREVPFYLLPHLGGSDGVRGYGAYRFVDRHALLVSAEYRWTPGEALDMAVFWDAGRVAARRGDLSLRDLRHAWGIGARFHSPSMTVLRMELAFGDEGPHLIVAFSPSF